MVLTYALISALILCCGYLSYRWLMADERQHGYNRALLYVIYVVALIAPLFLISGTSTYVPPSEAMIEIGEPKVIGQMVDITKHSGVSVLPILARALVLIYILGVGVMIMVSLIGMMSLWRVIAKGTKIPAVKCVLVITESKRLAPFSWMHFVVMNASDYAESGEVIIKHEMSHLRLRHWIDLMVAQLVICIQWFNPAAWLMRDEFRNVHEYQADEAVLKSGTDITEYQKMLIKKAVGSRFQSFANSLNHSKLKKRVTMMYKEKSSAARRMSALLLAPALAAGCFATAIPAVASVLDSFANVTFATYSENKVSKISDAPEIKISETVSTAVEETLKTAMAESIAKTVEEAEAPDMVNEDAEVSVYVESLAVAEPKKKVYDAPEQCAEYSDGMGALFKYLQANIKYPEDAIKNDEQGLVVVKFVIEADGSVNDVELVKSVTPALDAEAMRVVKGMPNWNPGKVDGKPVPTWFTLPVSFKLPADRNDKNDNK